jgi:hypothetical protein
VKCNLSFPFFRFVLPFKYNFLCFTILSFLVCFLFSFLLFSHHFVYYSIRFILFSSIFLLVHKFVVVTVLLLRAGVAQCSGSTVSDYGLDDRGSIPDTGRGFFFQPLLPDRLWGPPSLLPNGYWGFFPRG